LDAEKSNQAMLLAGFGTIFNVTGGFKQFYSHRKPSKSPNKIPKECFRTDFYSSEQRLHIYFSSSKKTICKPSALMEKVRLDF
jgi:hypothetical protein